MKNDRKTASNDLPRSFFGGDPAKAHFATDVRYRVPDENQRMRRERREEQRQVIKKAGFKVERYFEFSVGDETGKAQAKAKAVAYAQSITEATGIEIEVNEGCFL